MILSTEVFFGIPELVAHVLSFLDRQDLSRLMRASRHMYTTTAPLLFRDIDLRAIPDRRLAYTQNGLTSLARNAHLIKSIRMDGIFFAHYYECLATAAASEQPQDVTTGTGTGAGIGPPATGTPTFVDRRFPLAAPAVTSLEHVKFPRMNNLTRFEYNLPPPGGDWDGPKIPYIDDSHLVLSRFSLMIPPAQAPRLVSLTLNGPLIRHQRDLNFLTQTVAGMTGLQTLRLGIDREEHMKYDLVPRIFFRLPSSIQVFVIRVMNVGEDWELQQEGRDDTTPTAQEAYRRDGPFLKLKEWGVCVDYLMDNPEPYFLMLSYCPELELVMIPQMLNRGDEETLAQFIVRQCPKLRRLSRVDVGFILPDNGEDDEEGGGMGSEYGNCDGVMMKLTSEVMPEDTLEAFYYEGYYENSDLFWPRLTSMLSAQFQSLREVHLRRARGLNGYSITQLLNFTPLLESLIIQRDEEGWDETPSFGVRLQHLSDVSWASSRLQELRVDVDFGYLSIMDMNSRPFSLDSSIVDIMAMSLGGLVANIGKQTDLRVLDLRVAIPRHIEFWNGHSWTYRDEAFPGLLSLSYRPGNGQGHGGGHGNRLRRGYLDMLGGLSKLEELRGSVNLIPRDAYGYTIGREEAEWMQEHWPKLRVAEFYPTQAKNTYPTAAEFLWLQNQLPGLVYTDDLSA
ncbi:hypothetical protein EC957_002555 [Mortierella hygrophila]|uniref:F-box domain-containing protein n=1 Tax=Mortierella hygrophila TaxID=979708 RepID=A0A9P6F4U9_9FUNG|nr:hypothetical protein EC957_002555 [Mortierella hygrophila]